MSKKIVINEEAPPAKAFVNPERLWVAELAYSLMELYPELTAQGYSLGTIAKIMRGRDSEIILSLDEMQTVLQTKLGLI
jgi:hypothetical protein